MHHPEVHDGGDVARAEDVLELLAAKVDLRVVDVLRLVEEGPPVDADDAPLAMEHAREVLAEPAADAGDEHRAARGGRGHGAIGRRDVEAGRVRVSSHARAAACKKMCRRSFTPRFTMDWSVAFTSHTFSSMTASSSSGSPANCIGSPK